MTGGKKVEERIKVCLREEGLLCGSQCIGCVN